MTRAIWILGLVLLGTPIADLVVVIHPLKTTNFVFSSGDNVFESSLGAKLWPIIPEQLGQG